MTLLRTWLNAIPHPLYVILSAFVGAFVGFLQDPANGGIYSLLSPHSAKPMLIGAAFAGVGTLLALAKQSWLKTGGVTVLLLGAFLGISASACGIFSPSAIPPALTFVECVATDALEKKPISQIVIDCGQDVPAVIAALVTSKDPQVRTSAAFGEATRAKAAFLLETDAGAP